MVRTKQKRLSKKSWARVEQLLLHTLPGYRWFNKNRDRLNNDMHKMNAMQALNVVWKLVRYLHLLKIISGNYASDAALRQRRSKWIEEISENARKISLHTGIEYQKVFQLLYDRMKGEVWK